MDIKEDHIRQRRGFFLRFLWHNKKPMIRIKTLQLPVEQGSFALPNFRFYYWACHIRIIWDWLQSHLTSDAIECVMSGSLPATLYSANSRTMEKRVLHTSNVTLILTIPSESGETLQNVLGKMLHPVLTPLTRNEEFPPRIQNSVFDSWHKRGIRLIRDVCQGNILMSFQ